jgi:predicted negative regulator of RcsB-dependent stress response
MYEDVMYAAGTGNLDAAEEAANALFADYNESPYAAQARLAMARIYMDNARDQDAADVLAALIESQPDAELAMIGRLRLAKILLYQGNADDVIALIKDQPESAFSARFNEVLGDAYVAQERFAEAEAAYILALNDNPQAPTVDTSLIQLKINDLPPVSLADNTEAEADPAVTVVPSDEDAGVDDEAAEELAPAEPAEEPTEGESGNQ